MLLPLFYIFLMVAHLDHTISSINFPEATKMFAFFSIYIVFCNIFHFYATWCHFPETIALKRNCVVLNMLDTPDYDNSQNCGIQYVKSQ